MRNFQIIHKFLFIILLFLSQILIYPNKVFANDSFSESVLKKKLELAPNNYEMLKKLADLYCDDGNIKDAIIYYKKLVIIKNDEKDINKLGLLYFIAYDYRSAFNCFESALELNPKNERTQIKVEITKKMIAVKKENERINSLSPSELAPKKIHRLIAVEGKLKNPKSEEKLHRIIDFIWSDSQGKILLKNALTTNVEICLKPNIKYSSTMHGKFDMYESSKNYYGGNPTLKGLPSYNLYFISIKEKDIKNFQEKNSTKLDNERSIMVVSHELHHLLIDMNYAKPENSKLEETLCTIQGYELASRVLTGESLTEEELKSNISIFFNGLKYSQMYKTLERDNDAIRKMVYLGVYFPHLSLCQNLFSIDYNTIKFDPHVSSYVNKLGCELNENYESIFTKKKVFYNKKIFLIRNDVPRNYASLTNKYAKIEDREDIFNIMIEQYILIFPYGRYKGTMIPILITRNGNKIKLNTLSTK